MMFQLRKPNVIPINDHVWLLDDNYEASCYVVSGTNRRQSSTHPLVCAISGRRRNH